MQTRQWFSALLAVAILVNSLAVVYGFGHLRAMAETIQWISVPHLSSDVAQVSSAAVGAPAVTLETVPLTVDVFSDFACRFCRSNAPALDSVRQEYGALVRWRYRNVVQSPTVDPLSLQVAAIGICTSTGQWPEAVHTLLTDTVAWNEHVLDVLAASLRTEGVSWEECVTADSTKARIWRDLFEASARGINRTPTFIVGGTRIEGQVSRSVLSALVQSKLEEVDMTVDSDGNQLPMIVPGQLP